LELIVSTDERLPSKVKGNGDCFKQVIIYFTSNGFKNSTSVKLDINVIQSKEGFSILEIQVQDNGPGMTDEELDVKQLLTIYPHRKSLTCFIGYVQ
jgi:signal transduction histidine kinase